MTVLRVNEPNKYSCYYAIGANRSVQFSSVLFSAEDE